MALGLNGERPVFGASEALEHSSRIDDSARGSTAKRPGTPWIMALWRERQHLSGAATEAPGGPHSCWAVDGVICVAGADEEAVLAQRARLFYN